MIVANCLHAEQPIAQLPVSYGPKLQVFAVLPLNEMVQRIVYTHLQNEA